MSNSIKLILPGRGKRKWLVRNLQGNPIPCCWDDCFEDGDNHHRIEVDHPTPRHTGEKLVYVFCGPDHKAHYLKNTPWENRG